MVAENSGVTGFAFSNRMLQIAGLEKMEIPKAVIEGKRKFKYADLARSLAADGDVDPLHGDNWIKMWISDKHTNAGSKADFIRMYLVP